MGWWSTVREFFTLPVIPEQFAADESEPRPIDRVIVEMMGRGVAPRVGRIEALSVPAVMRGRNLICSIASLPLVQYGPDWRVQQNPLLEQIDPDVPNVVTLSQTLEDLLFEGIAWWRITEFADDGFPLHACHVDVGLVSLDPPAGKSPSPLPHGEEPRGAVVWIDGKEVPASKVIRFDSPNPGLLKAGGRAIRRALLLDSAASMYADEPRPLDFFTPTEGADPVDDDTVQDLLDTWKTERKKRGTAYVPAALKYNAVDQPTPADLQLVELQKRVSLDLANAQGLDPEDLGISTTSRTYQNATDRRQDRINDVFNPYMRAMTDRLSMGDVTKPGHLVRFDLDDYMRADPTTRWNTYQTAKEMGAITVPEIRDAERKPPLPPGAEPAPAAVRPLRAVPAAPAAGDQVAASRPAALELDAESGLTFANVPLATFAVNTATRTITGMAVPYGQFAVKNGRRWRFAPGSLAYAEVGRVKLLRDHVYASALGRAVELRETPQGLVVTFRVARGKAGDEALALAEDGVLDGLSIGVDIADAIPDPENQGVLLVRRALLREVSLTAMPAFDDSRVTSVAAARDGGTMQCSTCGHVHAEGVACTAPTTATVTQPAQPAQPAAVNLNAGQPAGLTLSAEQVAQLIAQPGGLAALFTPAAVQPAQPEQRQVVNPTRQTATTEVTEAAAYRFDRDGNLQRGTHDFSSDLVAASKGDGTALERAQTFMTEQFAVTQSNVSTLNPTQNRPDMYVDQREFKYPIWESIRKGSLTDNTPFTFPKFNSSSGMVAAHTEGTEPTPGAFTATSQTVTPSANSGKVEITRETWDQGGNPQVSNLIWRQMNRAWYESLEAAAVAVLDAATPLGITLTTGGGTTGQTLDSELTAAFAALQFIRGGFSMDTMFTQVDLFKALIAAKDNSGRRLYPAIGPQNASGTVSTRFGAIDVNGVTALPAWALAASGIVAASSYLFDSESVHGWASAPNRLDFQYRVAYVDVGIWGYKATAISDINGVRELIYDPA